MMHVGILGAGKVGLTLATMLDEVDFCEQIELGDNRELPPADIPPKAVFHQFDISNADRLTAFINGKDAVVSAAPYYLNPAIARACVDQSVAYFDLTEDIATTGVIRELAAHAAVPLMPQCGLAPGAINIIGGSLGQEVTNVRSLELRVGALPLYASNSMKYYLSWNTAGLINEYCHPADALYDGRRIKVLPLEGLECLTIDGSEYEAFNTSGGVGTLCETFEGVIQDLNYKTIRYPGHRHLMKFLLQDLNLIRNQKVLTEIFDQEVPLTETDVVIIYVNVVGKSERGMIQKNFVKKIYGTALNGSRYSAIQISTAAGMAAVLEIFHRGGLKPGFNSQESIQLDQFLATCWGGRIYTPDRWI